jgi:hypothetical protein
MWDVATVETTSNQNSLQCHVNPTRVSERLRVVESRLCPLVKQDNSQPKSHEVAARHVRSL